MKGEMNLRQMTTWLTALRLGALALILLAVLAACGGSDSSEEGPIVDTRGTPTTAETEGERTPPSGSAAMDREILAALYNALDGENWDDKGSENWLTDAPISEWYGVTQTDDNGRVMWLQLGASGSGQMLSGEIPPELGDLGALEVLNLHGDRLSGEIPTELANLLNLKNLYLSGKGIKWGDSTGAGKPPQFAHAESERYRVERGDTSGVGQHRQQLGRPEPPR